MNRCDRVVWSEGMFLSPQHFQQWDRYHRGELDFQRAILLPFAWGVERLAIDRDALGNGRFTVQDIRAILPDGTTVRAPEIAPLPASRQIDEHVRAELSVLGVFLALPEGHEGVSNCRLPDRPDTTESTYSGEIVRVGDDNASAKEIELLVAKQNLRLIFSDENLTGFTCLKIAEVRRSAEGRLELSPDYAAPCLSLLAAGPALAIARATHERLCAQAAELTELASQLEGGAFELGSSDAGRLMLHYIINSFLPLLAHYQRHPQIHPLELYLTLSQLTAALCVYSKQHNPREIPVYDHDNIGPSFRVVDRLLQDLWNSIIPPRRYQTITLVQQDPTVLTGDLIDDRFRNPGTQFCLGVRSDKPPFQVRDLIVRRLFIGSPHNIEFLVRRADQGVTREYTQRPPKDFPVKSGYTYFMLEPRGEIWESIVDSRAIAIYIGGEELRDQTYELWAIW